MILGLSGLRLEGSGATSGWALLDESTCTFVGLGVVIQPKRDAARTMTLERERRASVHAGVIAERAIGCSMLVVEQLPSGVDGRLACIAMGMSWGIILGAVAALVKLGQPRPQLLTLAPQRWQREVLPSADKEVDYEQLARAAGEHILQRHPKAAADLARIKEKDKRPAIDAAMIALCGALRPQRCDRVGEGATV